MANGVPQFGHFFGPALIERPHLGQTVRFLVITSGSTESVDFDIIVTSDAGTTEGDDVYISEIRAEYFPSDNVFVGKDKLLSDAAEIVEGEDLSVFLDGFDYLYKGLVGKTESIEFKPSGSDNYKLAFTIKSGDI